MGPSGLGAGAADDIGALRENTGKVYQPLIILNIID